MQPSAEPLWFTRQLSAGCSVLNSLMRLAGGTGQLSAHTAFKLGAACSLVLGPGAVVLYAHSQGAQTTQEPSTLGGIANEAGVQLSAVLAAMSAVLHPSEQPQAAAAFASNTAKPSRLLRWVAVLSGALQLAISSSAPGNNHICTACRLCSRLHSLSPLLARPCRQPFRHRMQRCAGVCHITLHNYLCLIHQLLSSETWSRHGAAIAADLALQRAIVKVLLEHCLPAAAAAVLHAEAPLGAGQHQLSLGMLHLMASILQQRALWPGIQQHARSGGAAAAGQYAATMLAAVPVAQPSDMPAGAWSSNLCSATALVATCCCALAWQHDDTGQHVSDAELGAPSAAGLHLTALLPQLAPAVAALVGDPAAQAAFPFGSSVWLARLDGICSNLCHPLDVLYSLPLSVCSPAQLACWLTATSASLRLLPHLPRLGAQLRRHSSSCRGAAVLCSELLRLTAQRLPQQLLRLDGWLRQADRSATALKPHDLSAWEGLPLQLWALHTGLCRLVAALAAPATSCLPGVQPTADYWRSLQVSLSSLLVLTLNAHRLREQPAARRFVDFLADAPR